MTRRVLPLRHYWLLSHPLTTHCQPSSVTMRDNASFRRATVAGPKLMVQLSGAPRKGDPITIIVVIIRGHPKKDVHTEEGVMSKLTNVDMGDGVFKLQ